MKESLEVAERLLLDRVHGFADGLLVIANHRFLILASLRKGRVRSNQGRHSPDDRKGRTNGCCHDLTPPTGQVPTPRQGVEPYPLVDYRIAPILSERGR